MNQDMRYRILLLEDNKKHADDIIKHIELPQNINRHRLVALTSSERKAIDYVKAELPHIIIVDLKILERRWNRVYF